MQTQDILPFTQKAIQAPAVTIADIDKEFVEAVRRHASTNGGNAAYVADTAQVSGGALRSSERYVTIVLPKTDATAIENRMVEITPAVRRTADGYPIACGMLAGGLVEVSLLAVSEAYPILIGRLNVLWVFRDEVRLERLIYTLDMEQDFGNASSVADAHRYEDDPYEDPTQRTPIEVHTTFVLDGILPPHVPLI